MRSRWTATVVVTSLVLFAALSAVSAQAASTVPFLARYTTNANGAIVTVGNTLLTCPASAASCAAARAGGNYNNNSFTMTHLDADNVAGTFSSSSSELALPEGAVVLWAGLYWGARLQAGTGGQAGTGTRTQMQLRPPGAAGYQTVTSQAEFGPNTSSYNAYQEFADVTAVVQAAGNGAYWGANVVAATGADRYAGWALTVAYEAPGMPLRNLTVFDGFDMVSTANPQTITISGFRAPLSGTVDTQLSMVAYEGDLFQAGDYTLLNTTQLATALSPGSNFFNSTNDLDGASVTSRTPADRNMLGFDIKNLGASGVIPNGATSATFTFSSSGDTYYPGVLTTAINLYAPDFTTSSKSVLNLDGHSPARPGDTLQYTVTLANTGEDPATGAVSEDRLPAGVTYVPGSLSLVQSPGATPVGLTDLPGDDPGEYAAASRTVRVRLGTGATPTVGGTMAVGSRTSYTFRVTVDDAAGGTTVPNQAYLDYRTGTTNLPASYLTNVASVDVVRRADLSVAKSLSPRPVAAFGGEVVATITVKNDGPNTATGVTLTDPLPPGWTPTSVQTSSGTCAVTTAVVCDLGNLAAGRSVTVTVRGTVASSAPTSLTNVAYAATTSYDPDLTNNVSGDTVALVSQADLSITKQATATTAPAGSVVSYTLTVTNDGPSDAADVVVSDVPNPSQLTVTSVAPSAGVTCDLSPGGSLTCQAGTLASGGTATVTVIGYLGSGLAEGTRVANTAQVTSTTADPDTTDNQATATVTVGAPEARVALTKTAPASLTAGTRITYQIVATNDGPSDAPSVTVTDPAPPGVTFTVASSSRGTCTVTGTLLTCQLGALPAAAPGASGASATITVSGTVDPDATTLVNTATATALGVVTTATATTGVVPSFDLAVTKQATRTTLPAVAGALVTYTLTVTNAGPSTATGVTLDDLVPLGLDLIGVTPQSGTCDTGQAGVAQPGDPAHGLVVCALGSIPAGGSQTVVVAMQSPGDLTGGGDLTETATVSAPGEDPAALANNSATWTLSGLPQSDLALTKTAPATMTAGSTATYGFDIDYQTDETVVAPAPTLVDTLPAGVRLVPAGDPGSVTPTWCQAVGQDVTCLLPANIAPNTSAQVQLTVAVDPAVATGTVLTNTATVVNAPSNPDPSLANNTSTATSQVLTQTDLAVSAFTITPYDPLSYTGPSSALVAAFTITNAGPSVARDVQFRVSTTTDLAVDLSLMSGCTIANGEFVCPIGDLDPGESMPLYFPTMAFGYVTPGTYENGVSVSTTTYEPDLSNNQATTDLVVDDPRATVWAGKTALDTVTNPGDAHPAYVAGTPFRYQVQAGTSDAYPYGADAQDVVVTDTLPAGFTATSAVSTQGTCTVGAGGTSVECQLGTVSSYVSTTSPPVTITVVGMVSSGAAAGEQLANTATVVSSTPDMDGDPTSVTASAAVDVISQADLQLLKQADATTFYVGGRVGYTLTVVDAGPSDVGDAVVDDTLPVGLTLDPTLSPGCTVTGGDPTTGQQVQCQVGAVGTAGPVSVRVVATTDPYDGRPLGCRSGDPCDPVHPRPITNTATVSSSATDPDPGNNTASADAQVDTIADDTISLAVSTTTPSAGGQIAYTAVLVNDGPSVADNPVATATFPPGFVPVSWNVPQNVCSWSPAPPTDPTTVSWSTTQYTLTCSPVDQAPRFAVFEPGVTIFGQVVMWIPADTPAGTYSTDADVATTTPESSYDNNHATVAVNVQLVSDTSVVKTLVDPDPMQTGRPATWRLTVTNAGPSVAHGIVVSDVVPDGMTFVSAQVEGGPACPAPPTEGGKAVVDCPVGTIGVGESRDALVTFAIDPVPPGSTLCNAALVGSGSLDPDAADNESQACSTTVEPPRPADPTLTDVTAPPALGDPLSDPPAPDGLAATGASLALLALAALLLAVGLWARRARQRA